MSIKIQVAFWGKDQLKWMLEIHSYFNNFGPFKFVDHLSMKHKDWSMKQDIHFERK